MFCKIVLAAVILVAAVASPVDKRSTSAMELVSIIQLEEPCVRQGGLCLRIEDCAAGNLVHVRGKLCPMQHHLGVECCYL